MRIVRVAWRRREFLKAAAWIPTAALAARAAEGGGESLRLSYQPPAEATPAIPAGFELPEQPRIRIEAVRREGVPPTLLHPQPPIEVAVLLEAQRDGEPGWLPLAAFANNDRDRLRGREALGLPVEDAAITLTTEGGGVTLHVDLAGLTLVRAIVRPGETAAPEAAAGPLWFSRAPASPDWTGGFLEAGSLGEIAAPSGPAEARAAEATALELGGFLEGWAPGEGVDIEAAYAAGQASSWTRVDATELAGAGSDGWAARRYPLAYPALTAAGELAERQEIQMRPLEIVELDAMISTEAHESLLPPLFRSGGRPMIKIFGVRAHDGDLARVRYQEAWLFAFAIAGGRAGWYALSHIVERGGDVVYGREAFGYPSRIGEPDVVVSPLNFSLLVRRKGREVAYADGLFQGFATGTTLGRLPVLTLRALPGGRRAEVLYQLWTYQGRRNRIDPNSLNLSLSDERADGLEARSDPWFELEPLRPIAASAMDNGAIQRPPAEKLLEWEDFGPYYRERCDGVLPWEPIPAEPPAPSFLVGGNPAASRS